MFELNLLTNIINPDLTDLQQNSSYKYSFQRAINECI